MVRPRREKTIPGVPCGGDHGKMQRRITLNLLPGCEWYDDVVKLYNYLMIDAGEKPGRGSGADSSRVFSRMAAPPTVILPGLLLI